MRDQIEFIEWHNASYEECEERLAFSADPLADLVLHGNVATQLVGLEQPDRLQTAAALSSSGNAGQAWSDVQTVRANYNLTGAGQAVAIIDTGIAYDHVALGGGFGTGTRVVGGWDFAENDADPYDDAPAGFHGTHVAGIVGAQDSRYSGVASGVDLVALRVFDDNGRGNFAWVESALQWVHQNRNAFANPITTVNMSIGTSWNADTVPNWANLEEELAQLKADGIFISVSAGNSFSTYNAPGLSYPAVSEYVVPVASVSSTGQISSFSQRNSRVLAAPGQTIMSTVPDYLYGADGIKNDFASATGTSMAAPWVAGAAALVREAMQRVGYTNITQDTIYNHLRGTADAVFDSVTNATYYRVNLKNAIDSLLATDDFGNTSNWAFNLGQVTNNTATVSGKINSVTDVDCFSFTAGRSGTATLQLTSPAGVSGQWEVEGVTTGSGNKLTFQVTSGQTYVVKLSGGGTVGAYNLAVSLDAVNWGAIDFAIYGNQRLTGEQWIGMTASRDGYFTVESWFNNSAGNVDLEIYDANRTLIASSATTNNSERVDALVRAGDKLWVRTLGTNDNVTFRCTNLVSTSGQAVFASGTSGDDLFVLLPGATQSRIAVNGVGYDFAASQKREFYITDTGGNDTYVLVGTDADETAQIAPGSVIVSTNQYSSICTGAETVFIAGQAGRDTAQFRDGAGYDAYYGTPDQGQLVGNGYTQIAAGFETYRVDFTAGGYNQAWLYGSIYDDTFTASPSTATLSSAAFAHTVNGQNTCVAVGGAGYDLAVLNDSAGDDTFQAVPNAAALYNNSYYIRADAFDRVEARATLGNDTATFTDTAGDDYFAGSQVLAYLRTSDTINVSTGFDTVIARSSGGADVADLYDSVANDRFTILGRLRTMETSEYKVQVDKFTTVRAYSNNGGFDTLLLYDLANTDNLKGRPGSLVLTNSDSVENYGFEKAVAYARSGQRPNSDIAAVDYLFSKIGF